MPLTHDEAGRMLAKARDPLAGKPLQNNTRLYQRGDGYAVRFHATDVVLIHPDGTYTLNSGGWMTLTTKDRIESSSPARISGKVASGWTGRVSRGPGNGYSSETPTWFLRRRPRPEDPMPEVPYHGIDNPGQLLKRIRESSPLGSTYYNERYGANIAEYGSEDAWREAYRTAQRKRVAKMREYRQWAGRNFVRFFDGVRVDAEGYPIFGKEG